MMALISDFQYFERGRNSTAINNIQRWLLLLNKSGGGYSMALNCHPKSHERNYPPPSLGDLFYKAP